jgi:spermidine/putrescine transport system substrate-binding protein
MAMHPRERGRPRRWAGPIDRREFLRRSALAAMAVPGAGALLAACGDDNGGSSGTTGNGGDDTSGFVLSRPDNPVTLPLKGEPIADGLQPESGTLKIFNYADYINPDTLALFEERFGVKTDVTTFTTMDEAKKKLRTAGSDFDVFFATTDVIGQIVEGGLLQPLNKSYLPNLANFWSTLQDPFYDQGSQYSVPYVLWTTGIGYRTDLVDRIPDDYENPYDILWDSANKGKTWVLDDDREILGMALLRNGVLDVNIEDPATIDAALGELLDLVDTVNVKYGIEAYTKLPEGIAAVHQAWSGDLVNAQYYLPDGGDVATLAYWFPADGRGVIGNDTLTIPTAAKHPVLAHEFLNFMTSEEGALDNFSWLGWQPALNSLDPDTLVADEWIPENLASTIIRPEDFDASKGVQLLQLSLTGEKLWDEAYAKFQAGAT